MRRYRLIALAVMPLLVARLAAQGDTTTGHILLRAQGSSDAQPGLIVLAGAGLDSVRTIVERDLGFSDRFTVPRLADSVGTLHGPLNPLLYRGTGAAWVVELEPAIHGVDVKLYDGVSGVQRQEATMALTPDGTGDGRLAIHRVSDQVVAWTGGIGIAATRIAFVMGLKAVWRIDFDGANLVRVSGADTQALGPAWSPDGKSLAFSEYRDALWSIYVQKLATGARTRVPDSSVGNDNGPSFSPDGKTLVYAHSAGSGSDIESVDLVQMCCNHRLTFTGKLADNVTPTYSPDGHRIAFMSTRSGTPELYVMDDDGTNTHLLVPSDFEAGGRPLAAYRPAWSPDGAQLAFGRDTQAGRGLYSALLRSGQVVARATAGEDPSYAPDSRHVVFKSRRTGREQLWILDTESGVLRQLPTPGIAQVPAWSPSLGTNP